MSAMSIARMRAYKGLALELKHLKEDIGRLEIKLGTLPAIASKVQSSAAEYPYLPQRVSVEAYDPIRADKLQRMKIKKEALIDKIISDMEEIEEYIEAIPDAKLRYILREVYLKGRSQTSVAYEMGMKPSSVSKMISKIENNETE